MIRAINKRTGNSVPIRNIPVIGGSINKNMQKIVNPFSSGPKSFEKGLRLIPKSTPRVNKPITSKSDRPIAPKGNGLYGDWIPSLSMKRGFFSTLMTGDTGSSVSELQAILGRLGYAVPQTGIFEETTSAAVAAFQTQVSIKADGAVGYQTWSALDDAVARLLPGGGSVSTTVPLPQASTASIFGSITKTQLYIYGGLAVISGLGIYFYIKSKSDSGKYTAMNSYRQDRYLK